MRISRLHFFKIPKALVLRGNKVMIACKRFDRTRKQPVTTNKVELENFSPTNQVSTIHFSRLCRPSMKGEQEDYRYYLAR